MKLFTVGSLLYILAQYLTAVHSNPVVTGVRPSTPRTSGNRIIAIGDLHGDFNKFERILQSTVLIDENGDWIGRPGTKLIITGDITDRGPDALRIFQLIRKLQIDAKASKCEVVMLLGNHEVMNMAGETKYVSKEEYDSFDGEENRAEKFKSDNEFGSWLRDLPIFTKEGDTIFVHGGISGYWADKIKAMGGLETVNERVKKLMQDDEWEDDIFWAGRDGRGYSSNTGPLWYRGYSIDGVDCKEIRKALASLGGKRMVMGHSITGDGLIQSKCDGQILLIDIGISAFYEGKYRPVDTTHLHYGAKIIPRCGALEIDSTGAIHALYCLDGPSKAITKAKPKGM